jgi:hypothetical protein
VCVCVCVCVFEFCVITFGEVEACAGALLPVCVLDFES